MSDVIKQFYRARYWVGCSSESAEQIFFDLNEVLANEEHFMYIAAFDSNGKWVDEAKVQFYEENGEPYLNFAY